MAVISIFRIVSLSSVVAAIRLALLMLLSGGSSAYVVLSLVASLMVLWRHRSNITTLKDQTFLVSSDADLFCLLTTEKFQRPATTTNYVQGLVQIEQDLWLKGCNTAGGHYLVRTINPLRVDITRANHKKTIIERSPTDTNLIKMSPIMSLKA